MRSPNLNALRMFDASARHLNFRIAAEELNLTQGAVAQQVRRLEAELGFQLFHRKSRGLALTETGRSYHKPIRRGLAIIEDATHKLRPESAGITLSVTPSFAAKWLVPRLAEFALAHPDIDVNTIASDGLADFQSDGIDIAVRQGRAPFGDGLRVDLLSPLELCAVCSPSYARQVGKIGQIEDFTKLQLIQDGHNHWDRLLEDAGTTAQHRILQFNQTALAMDAAANGQGITLAPRLLFGAELAQGKLVELWHDTRANQGGYYAVQPINRKPNPGRDVVVNWLLAEARNAGAEESKINRSNA